MSNLQVVGRDVRRGAAGRSQSHREAAGQVEKHFRHEVAGIADGAFSVGLALLDKRVVRFLKQILKEDEMLKIFQQITPQIFVFCPTAQAHPVPPLPRSGTYAPMVPFLSAILPN